MSTLRRVAVFGASGFVGSEVVRALKARGVSVVPIPAPRVTPLPASDAVQYIDLASETRTRLMASLEGCTAVVNAAGNPDASSNAEPELIAANAVSVALIAQAARDCGVARFVHVSSAVVQGDTAILTEDASTRPFSAYSRSKALGEKLASQYGPAETVVYRPPSVHSPDRRVTRAIHRIASSPLSTTVAPGSAHSPQALLPNVADAVAHLAICSAGPPLIVIHPWEGITTAGLLEVLGGKAPRLVPRALAKVVLTTLRGVSRVAPRLEANRRRVELLWVGQGQASSWLTRSGWTPPVGTEGWLGLRASLTASPSPSRD